MYLKSIAETTASPGIARNVDRSLSFEADSDMTYVKKMQDEGSISTKTFRRFFDKKDLAPKLKLNPNTDKDEDREIPMTPMRSNFLNLSFHI